MLKKEKKKKKKKPNYEHECRLRVETRVRHYKTIPIACTMCMLKGLSLSLSLINPN